MTRAMYGDLCSILGEPMDIIEKDEDNVVALWQPINDRTLDDCVYGNPRGCLDFVCVNRISANLEYIQYHMHLHGYYIRNWYTPKVYTRSDYFKAADYNTFVEWYTQIAEQINMPDIAPRTVPGLTMLLYTDVNDLETVILTAKDSDDRMESAYWYTGEVCAGEV